MKNNTIARLGAAALALESLATYGCATARGQTRALENCPPCVERSNAYGQLDFTPLSDLGYLVMGSDPTGRTHQSVFDGYTVTVMDWNQDGSLGHGDEINIRSPDGYTALEEDFNGFVDGNGEELLIIPHQGPVGPYFGDVGKLGEYNGVLLKLAEEAIGKLLEERK